VLPSTQPVEANGNSSEPGHASTGKGDGEVVMGSTATHGTDGKSSPTPQGDEGQEAEEGKAGDDCPSASGELVLNPATALPVSWASVDSEEGVSEDACSSASDVNDRRTSTSSTASLSSSRNSGSDDSTASPARESLSPRPQQEAGEPTGGPGLPEVPLRASAAPEPDPSPSPSPPTPPLAVDRRSRTTSPRLAPLTPPSPAMQPSSSAPPSPLHLNGPSRNGRGKHRNSRSGSGYHDSHGPPWGREEPERRRPGGFRGRGRGAPQRPSWPIYTPVPPEEVHPRPPDLLPDTPRRVREQLSAEIEDMAAGLLEVAKRRQPWQNCALRKLEQVINRIWPSARMEVYGSYTTGLSIPASDVDVVITSIPEGMPWRGSGGAHHLTTLADQLQSQDWVSSVQCIKHTSVPIVKLTTAPVPTRFGDSRGVIKIDVSFDWPAGTHRGMQSSILVQRLCAMNRHLAPLVVVLKQLLLQRGLNDAYTGGLSSYALTIMVASILQRHRLEPPELQPDLGTIFITFLQVQLRSSPALPIFGGQLSPLVPQMFGTQLDTRRYGVILSNTGPLFQLNSYNPHVPRVGTPEYWQPADPVVRMHDRSA
jgi:predicted nucleotidyltransferase